MTTPRQRADDYRELAALGRDEHIYISTRGNNRRYTWKRLNVQPDIENIEITGSERARMRRIIRQLADDVSLPTLDDLIFVAKFKKSSQLLDKQLFIDYHNAWLL